jgi:hypothetical protein
MPTIYVDTGYRPRPKQLEVHKRRKRFTVLVAHRRFGKTTLSVNTLLDAALRCDKPLPRFAYLAPFLKQAKQDAWDFLKRHALPIPQVEKNEQELSVTLPGNKAVIRLFGGDNPDALRGTYFDGIVIDEMAFLRPDVWGAVIRPALMDRTGWAMFIGTPHGVNQFSEMYNYAVNGKDGVRDPDWVGLMYRADETGVLDERELASSRAVMTDAQYRQEMLCDFNAASDNALITIDQVSDACKRAIREGDLIGIPRVLGVDVARFGDDRSVILRRQGLCCFDPTILSDVDNMTLAGHVAGHIEDWQPDAVFIDAGRGEGVIDRLRQLGYSIVEVNFGGRPDNPHYANKRTEMWDKLAQWLRAGGALPGSTELKSDLCAPTYSFAPSGAMVLESKDDLRERGLRSPDVGDALALTFAHPVGMSRAKYPGQRRGVIQTDYDPLEAA